MKLQRLCMLGAVATLGISSALAQRTPTLLTEGWRFTRQADPMAKQAK